MGTIFTLLERDNFGGRVMMTSNVQNSDNDSESEHGSSQHEIEIENESGSDIHTDYEKSE